MKSDLAIFLDAEKNPTSKPLIFGSHLSLVTEVNLSYGGTNAKSLEKIGILEKHNQYLHHLESLKCLKCPNPHPKLQYSSIHTIAEPELVEQRFERIARLDRFHQFPSPFFFLCCMQEGNQDLSVLFF